MTYGQNLERKAVPSFGFRFRVETFRLSGDLQSHVRSFARMGAWSKGHMSQLGNIFLWKTFGGAVSGFEFKLQAFRFDLQVVFADQMGGRDEKFMLLAASRAALANTARTAKREANNLAHAATEAAPFQNADQVREYKGSESAAAQN
jgi:hypothetical protein